MAFRFFGKTHRPVPAVFTAAIFTVLIIAIYLVLPKQGDPQPGRVQSALDSTPEMTFPATNPSHVIPTSDAASATLQHFPLLPGATWTYADTVYDPDPTDFTKTVKAVFEVTLRVTDVKTGDGAYFAHIQNLVKKLSEDPAWASQGQNPPKDASFWYILRGDKVYSGPDTSNPETIPMDQLTLELVFPIAKDAEWCPVPVGKAETGPNGTLTPCQYVGKRVVLAETSFQSPVGNFDSCYQLSDIYNGGEPIRIFCDGVGVVEIKYDHAGTRFGFLQTLISFKSGK
jgi:hypothetical protein